MGAFYRLYTEFKVAGKAAEKLKALGGPLNLRLTDVDTDLIEILEKNDRCDIHWSEDNSSAEVWISFADSCSYSTTSELDDFLWDLSKYLGIIIVAETQHEDDLISKTVCDPSKEGWDEYSPELLWPKEVKNAESTAENPQTGEL